MAQIPPIDDSYIDDIIKAQDVYNPGLNKTQGVKLRELVKLLRDRLEQETMELSDSKVDKLTGYQLSQESYSPEEKSKLAGLREHFRGYYISVEALTAAVPTGSAGDYAFVDQGPDTDAQLYVWDTSDNKWVASAGGSNVLDTILTGIDFDSVAAVLATDNILTAFGKLQAQLNGLFKIPAGGTAGQVLTKIDGTDGNLHWANGAGGGYISHTYAELKELIAAAGLIPGQRYLLTDYNTQYKQPGSDVIKTDAPVEPLVLTAATVDAFFGQVLSPSFPKDYIMYDFSNNALTPIIPGSFVAGYHTIGIDGMDLPGDDGTLLFMSLIAKVDGSAGYTNDLVGEFQLHDAGTAEYIQPWPTPLVGDWAVVAYCPSAVYTGPAFKVKINEIVYTVNAADVPVNIPVGTDQHRTDAYVILAGTGNCIIQPYGMTADEPAVITEPDPTDPIPGAIRPGFITHRIDEQGNDAYFDHRNVLVMGETQGFTGAVQTLSINGAGVLFTDSDPFKDAKICIGDFTGLFAVGSFWSNNTVPVQTGWLNLNIRPGDPFREFQIAALGKCDVETYCLINGVQYTIPPFDNNETTAIATPIATVTGNIFVQCFTDAGSPPEYVPLENMDYVPAVAGEVPAIGPNCIDNKIRRAHSYAPEIPLVSLADGCSHNDIQCDAEAVFLPPGAANNTIVRSAVRVSDMGSVANGIFTDANVTIRGSSYQDTVSGYVFLIYSQYNRINGSGLEVSGGNNTVPMGLMSFKIYGDFNTFGYNSSMGAAYGLCIGNYNTFLSNFDKPCILGNGNDGGGYGLGGGGTSYIVGNDNVIRGGGYGVHILGNRNKIKALNGFVIQGDDNEISGFMGVDYVGVYTGKGFNNNKLVKSSGTFGVNCQNNVLINTNSADFGDDYSNHVPWV